jgi:hypothetical protein
LLAWELTLAPVVVLCGVLVVDPAADRGSLKDQSALVVVLVGTIGAGTAISGAVMLVNRPRLLVPPRLRDQPGLLAEARRTVAKPGRS